MIDSHCHLNYIEKSGSVSDLVTNANDNGVHTILNIGTDLKSSEISVAYASQFDSVFAAVGINPSDAKHANDQIISKIKELTSEKKLSL